MKKLNKNTHVGGMPSGIDYQPIMEGGRIPKKGSDSNIVKGLDML